MRQHFVHQFCSGRCDRVAIAVLLGTALLGAPPMVPAAAPPGSYSTHFVLPKPADCIPAGEHGFTEPVCIKSEVGRVMILEESTSEIMAECEFEPGGADFVTGSSKPGTSYACERKLDPQSGQTDVWVYSKQANLPTVHYYFREADPAQQFNWGGFIWSEGLASAADGVVHSPDGLAYADPYDYTELKFDGQKELFLVAKKGHLKAMNRAVAKLKNAGYDAYMRRFDNGVGEVNVDDTFDGRKLMYEKVLKKDGWVISKDPAGTRGNKGTYDLAPYILSFNSVLEETSQCGGGSHVFRGGFQIELPLMPDDRGGFSGEGTLDVYGDSAAKAWEYTSESADENTNLVCAIRAKPAGFRARFTGDERLLVAIDMDTEDFSCVEGDTPPAPLETGGGLWWTNFALLLHRDDLQVDEAQETVWTDLTPDPPTVQDDTRVKRWDVTQSAFDCGKLIEKTAVELKKTGN